MAGVGRGGTWPQWWRGPSPAPPPPPAHREHDEACQALCLVRRLSAALRPGAKGTPVVPLARKRVDGDSGSGAMQVASGDTTPGRPPGIPGRIQHFGCSPMRHCCCWAPSPRECRCGCSGSCVSLGGRLLHEESTASLSSGLSSLHGQHCTDHTPSCSSRTCAGRSRSSGSTPRTSWDPAVGGPPAQAAGAGLPGREVFSLFSSPSDQPPIDVRLEVQGLLEALTESGARTRLNVGVATAGSLTKLLTLTRSRKGLVLHLAAHAIHHEESGDLGLVLEDTRGASHVLWHQDLEQLLGMREQGLRNISLLFLSTCWSQELAQIFVECGCRHVIALRTRVSDSAARRFSQHLFLSLGVGETLLAAWEGARRALAVDSNRSFAEQAEHFMLFGQHGAEQATLDSLCGAGEHAPEVGPLIRDLEDASAFIEVKLPPRKAHFRGRTQTLLEILQALGIVNSSRACAVHGPAGIGKSALGVELAHFASAPGRLFSCAARILRLESLRLLDVLSLLEEELGSLRAQLRVEPPPGDSHRSVATPRHSSPSLRSDPSSSSLHSGGDLDTLAFLLPMRKRIRDGFQHLEKARRKKRFLLVVDDEVGALSRGADILEFLGDLLQSTHRLQVFICSREPVYRLRDVRVVSMPLRGLEELDAAKLLLQRIHRPLTPQDFVPPPDVSMNWRSLDDVARQLRGHPLLARLGGHPGSIQALGSRVVPGGPSLAELARADQSWSPGAARDGPSPARWDRTLLYRDAPLAASVPRDAHFVQQ